MNIDFMTKEDILEVFKVERDCFCDPWTEKMFEGELLSEHTVYLKAEDRNKIVGYAGAWCVAGDADITNVAVISDYRRQGIGQKLLSRLIEELIKKNAENIRLEVRKSNEGAIELNKKAGFLEIAVRKNYYKNNHEDALILELILGKD